MTDRNFRYDLDRGGGGGVGTPLCDLNGDVRPNSVWFSGCFVLNGVSFSSLSLLNRVSLHDLMAETSVFLFHSSLKKGVILG